MNDQMSMTVTIVQSPKAENAYAWVSVGIGEAEAKTRKTWEASFPVSDWTDSTMWVQMVLARLTDAA